MIDAPGLLETQALLNLLQEMMQPLDTKDPRKKIT